MKDADTIELKAGMRVWGRTVISARRTIVPTCVLIDSVARKHPNGLPAWDAVISSPYTKSGKIAATVFDYDVPDENTNS